MAIHVAEESLIVALELVVQGHSSDGGTTPSQLLGRMQVGAIQLCIVGQLSRLHDTRIELLVWCLRIPAPMTFKQLAATLRQCHKRRLLSTNDVRSRFDESFLAQPSELALSGVGRASTVIEKVLGRDDSKGASGCQDPDF